MPLGVDQPVLSPSWMCVLGRGARHCVSRGVQQGHFSEKRYKEKELSDGQGRWGTPHLDGVRRSFSKEVTVELKPECQGGAGHFKI